MAKEKVYIQSCNPLVPSQPEGPGIPAGPQGPMGYSSIIKGSDTENNIRAKTDMEYGDIWIIQESPPSQYDGDGLLYDPDKMDWINIGRVRGYDGTGSLPPFPEETGGKIWKVNTDYYRGDIISNDYQVFVCTIDHTSSDDFNNDVSFWANNLVDPGWF